ncbi:uncharacterized protein BX664DRAFT_13109 [Halteromyces radiatus]|uniref:uncharacterized protein n=1 Tax=Halteromyces radiatus TaxID=101107 RepID=UPI00221F74AE|nr:uncharacterized protein BX664DRAFT_13109 [Halteromyces radiatus]KAI8099101.1 hypothetical protein BX664DRAFT_13109 [Halteromyces radiatus]
MRRQEWKLKKMGDQLTDEQRCAYENRITYLRGVMDALKADRIKLEQEKIKKDTTDEDQKKQDDDNLELNDDLDVLAVHDDLDTTGYELDDLQLPSINNDVSARRIGSLGGILVHMLLSEKASTLDATLLKDHAKRLDLLDKEIRARQTVYRYLKLFIVGDDKPKYFRLNMIIFGNEVLRLCGYQQFCMRYSPIVSQASIYSLSLDAPSLYELFGKTLDMAKKGITSIALSRHKKRDVFDCLFDLNVVDSICKKNGLEFVYRMDITPANDTSLIGITKKPRQQSLYQQRLKFSEDIISNEFQTVHTLDTITNNINKLEKDQVNAAKLKRSFTKQLDDHRKVMREEKAQAKETENIDNVFTSKLFEDVGKEKELKRQKQAATQAVHRIQDELAVNRKIRYQLEKNRRKQRPKTKKTSPPPPSKITPTSRMEESPKHVTLDFDIKNCIITGTDYGVATLATTVGHTVEQLDSIQNGKFVKLQRPTTMTAKDIEWKTGRYHFRKKLERKKKSTDAGKEATIAEKIVGENTMYKAKDAVDLIQRYDKIRDQGSILRKFYGSKWIRRQQRLMQWRKKYTLKEMIKRERQTLAGKNILIRAIGDAGTGVGSRIKGHLKYGGKWHRRLCSQHGVVLVTNEHRTSMICPFCYGRIVHPRKKKNGKILTNNGTSNCMNPNCESYKQCKNSFGRDTLSSTCIALRCYGQIIGQDFL